MSLPVGVALHPCVPAWWRLAGVGLCGLLLSACQHMPMPAELAPSTGLAAAPPDVNAVEALPADPAQPPPAPEAWAGLPVAQEAPIPTAVPAPAAWVATPLPTPLPPGDLWARIRQGMRLPEPSGVLAERVALHERWYRAHGEHLWRTFSRAQLYLFDIVEAVERQGLPLEIALLPAVESAFVPQARSSAAAAGLWQFIPSTGRQFKLQQHGFQDDRRSVRAATQAALQYLSTLQTRYGAMCCWP